MAQDTEEQSIYQEPETDHHIHANPPHPQNPEKLHVATDDPTSEKDTRERLKKTSLASIPRDISAVNSSNTAANNSLPDVSKPPEQESLNQTPSPTSESRGRLSRKRSYDDSIEPVSTTIGPSVEGHHKDEESKHARKRSRDVRAVQPQNTKSAVTPIEGSLLEREASSEEALDDENSDRAMEGSVHGPRMKRSRDGIDTDLHREQKIAATDEAKAYRRSEDSERSQMHPQENSVAAKTNSDDQQEQQAATSTADIHSTDPTTQLKFPQANPAAATTDQKGTSKVPTSFATSGFAAMSGSSTSPFGGFGAPKTSVFGSRSPTEVSAPSTAKTGINGLSTSQSNAPSAFGSAPSPFLNSSSMTGSGFGASVTGSKPAGFGGSVFGGGFGNPTAGAPKLSSFAAPTSDAAVPKSTESKTAFGAQADDSGEEDAGSEGDANPEDIGAEKDETDSRFEQQEVETGEAGEESIFMSPRAQLYNFDNGGWKEKGRGVFKLNVSENEGARKARFIMRANQTFRVLVNQPVFQKMQVGDRQGREPSGKQFAFAVIDQGRPTPHLLKLGDETEAKKLYREVMKLQQDLATQA